MAVYLNSDDFLAAIGPSGCDAAFNLLLDLQQQGLVLILDEAGLKDELGILEDEEQ